MFFPTILFLGYSFSIATWNSLNLCSLVSFYLSHVTFGEGRPKGGIKATFKYIEKITAKICIINHSLCPPGTAQGVMA